MKRCMLLLLSLLLALCLCAGPAAGRVQVMLSPDQIRQLDYQVFLAVIL
ncbi:MAG: hypothetical protein IJI09_07070 [Clostridia bacterium]|nr:hypothetical protein [Clostridia bacterium]